MRVNAETEDLVPACSSVTLAPDVELEKVSPYTLIALMRLKHAGKEEDRELVGEACRELVRRFEPLLLAAARKYDYLGAKYDSDFLVNGTIFDAYETEEFDTTPQDSLEKENEKVLIRLYTILKNKRAKFFEVKRSKDKDRDMVYLPFSRVSRSLSDRKQLLYHRSHCMKLFMATLSPANADILRTSYEYYNDSTRKCEIPDDVREALCSRINISEDNLRVRRSRLLKKLRVSIESCESNLRIPCLIPS